MWVPYGPDVGVSVKVRLGELGEGEGAMAVGGGVRGVRYDGTGADVISPPGTVVSLGVGFGEGVVTVASGVALGGRVVEFGVAEATVRLSTLDLVPPEEHAARAAIADKVATRQRMRRPYPAWARHLESPCPMPGELVATHSGRRTQLQPRGTSNEPAVASVRELVP